MTAALHGLGPTAAAAEGLPGSPQTAFLEALVGRWHGRALRTPRGPLPYDIHLQRGPDGAVAGVANPGAALHHWRLFIEDGRLRLRFLTTFGGNDQPIRLAAETLSEGVASFRAEDPPYLTVRIAPSRDAVDIRVRLRDQPHVYIRLTRNSTARVDAHPISWLPTTINLSSAIGTAVIFGASTSRSPAPSRMFNDLPSLKLGAQARIAPRLSKNRLSQPPARAI